MKSLEMHSIIFQICKSNQIKWNYKRTSTTMATKQVCWPHSKQTSKTQLPNFPQVKYRHLAETPVEIKGFFSSPLPICSFLPGLLSQIAFLCNSAFPVYRQEQCSAGGSLPGHPGSSAVSLPTLLQRHSSSGQ